MTTITVAQNAVALQGNSLTPVVIQVNYDVATPGVTKISSIGVSIAWSNSVSKDNRIYYGLNETDVNNYIGGNWSIWDNATREPKVRITGLKPNTTYYYKRQTWYQGNPDNLPVSSFMTFKPGVWTSPAEAMVSSSTGLISPTNFRTINISAAPLNQTNGRYITGLSPLQAVIYNILGEEIGRVNLNGNGPYYGEFLLSDYILDGGYYIEIPGYPNIKGEASVLRWGCADCHSAGGPNYPSTFDFTTVHSKHFDTTILNPPVIHKGNLIATTRACESNLCHSSPYKLYYPAPCTDGCPQNWSNHPQSGACVNCHSVAQGGNAAVSCERCHGDKGTYQSLLDQRYGIDAHKDKQTCSNCHGTLDVINSKPSCTTCHPRPGKGYLTIPASIRGKAHSSAKTVDCGICHNSEHDIKSLTNDSTTCRSCHVGINHDGGSQCVSCHGNDIHNITSAGGEDCITCHGTGPGYPNPMARTTLVNISAFNESIHQNINASKNPAFRDNRTSNEDCWQCHYLKSMRRNEIRGCNYCHRNVPQWHGNANITTNWSHLW